MMFLAGMQAIPSEQYEAAALDGANVFRRFLDVTLPGLRAAIVVTTMLSTIWTANSINFVFVLTHGGPARRDDDLPHARLRDRHRRRPPTRPGGRGPVLFFPAFIGTIVMLTKRMLSTEARG